MDDGYEEMGREELLFRCRDWRTVANDRTARIGELEAENARLWAERDEAKAMVNHLAYVMTDDSRPEETTSIERLAGENVRLRAVVEAADEILRLCENCHDDWLRAQDAAGVNLQAERDQLDVSGNIGDRCGAPAAGGSCVLERGHNMGQVDIPEKHWAGPPHHVMPGEGIEGYLRRTTGAPEDDDA